VVGLCEHSNESLDYIKDGQFLDNLGDCELLSETVLHGVGWLLSFLLFNVLAFANSQTS